MFLDGIEPDERIYHARDPRIWLELRAAALIGKADPPRFAACVVLATTRLDVNGVVRRRLGTRKASFAPADDVVRATGMAIGGVTPLALPDGLPLWVDAAVMARERIVLGAGSRNAKVLAAPAHPPSRSAPRSSRTWPSRA